MIDPRLFAASLLLCCAAAQADPNEGARSVDFRHWSVKQNGAADVVWPEIGVGCGVSKRWATELLASYIGPSISSARLSSLNWQNDFLLTQGRYPVDVALHTNANVFPSAGSTCGRNGSTFSLRIQYLLCFTPAAACCLTAHAGPLRHDSGASPMVRPSAATNLG